MKLMLRSLTIMLMLLTRTPALAAQYIQSNTQNRPQIDEECPQSFRYNLSGLYNIPDHNLENIKQPISEFSQLYQQAHVAQHELEVLCKSIALNTNTTPLFSGVKSQQRALAKIQTELSGQTDRITDLARATLTSQDIPSLMKAYQQLNNQAELLQVKNRFKTPAQSGYRDLKVLIRLPQSGIIAEVQFHLEEIAKIKNGAEHDLYAQIQATERQAVRESRPLTDLEKNKIKKHRHLSQSLYNDAWQYYLTPNNQSTAA